MTEAVAEPPQPCVRCGQVHERNGRPTCRAHTRRDGVWRPCRNGPVQGAAVCRFHGGGAPQVQRAAAERQTRDAMDNVLRLVMTNPDPRYKGQSPDEQLLDEVARSATVVEWLSERVAELKVPTPDDAGPLANLIGVDPETGDPILDQGSFNLWGPDHNGDAAPHIYWGMLNQERDRHARLCKLAIDAGISERLVRIAEAQGAAIVTVLLKVLDRLELAPKERDLARRYAAEELRALSGLPAATPS
jgi:hypothetical protein